MKNLKKSNFGKCYISSIKCRNSGKVLRYRCQFLVDGFGSGNKYFDTLLEAQNFKESLNLKEVKKYKKSDVEYYSVGYLFREMLLARGYKWKESTIKNKKSAFHSLFPSLYNVFLHKLTKDHVLNIVLAEKNLNSMKIWNGLHVLNEIHSFSLDKYDYGLDWDVNYFRKDFKYVRSNSSTKRQYHTREEMEKISSFLKDSNCPLKHSQTLYHVYKLGTSTGCRIGELCSLKKSNVDFGTKKLVIDSSVSVGLSTNLIDSNSTKTGSSRVIELSPSGIKAIKYLSSINPSSPYVIPNFSKTDHLFMKPCSLNVFLVRVCKLAGVLELTSHKMFRKTFATLVAKYSEKSDTDKIKVIQKHLGHKSPQMTMHYIQLIDEDLEGELSNLFG